MRKVPARFQRFNTEYPKVAEAYENLATECHNAGPLSKKERSLVQLGVAIGSGMEGSVHSQVRKGLDAGLTPEEIRHAFMLAITAIGFPRMMATFTWAEDILNQEKTP